MSDTRFDVYFSGQLAPGVDAGQAAAQLARLFKTQPDRLAPLFTGKPALVKRNLSRAEAVRYRQALSQAGMTSIFREHGAPAPLPISNREPDLESTRTSPKALGRQPDREPVKEPNREPKRDTPAPESAVLATPPVGNIPPVAPGDTAGTAFTLAPAGSDVLTPEERRQTAPVEVDISGLSLAPAGTELLRPEERRELPALEVDTSALQLLPALP